MRSQRNNRSKSTKKLNLGLEHRKLKLSKSSHHIFEPLKPLSTCVTTSDSEYLPLQNSEVEEPLFLHVPNKDVLRELKEYPVRRAFQEGDISSNGLKKHLMVISKIAEFNEQYDSVIFQLKEREEKVDDIEWLLISRAINSKAIEIDFNNRYRPIKFQFVPGPSAVVNHLDFPGNQEIRFVGLDYFSRIVNFEAFVN